jgi:DNA repair exonuclease SbcCD ATPase subunit
MSNKYANLVEEINKQEEIAEQKENLTEQLSQVTNNVNDVKEIVGKLEMAIEDLKKIVPAVTAASQSTDNAVEAITQAILDSRDVVFTNKLDDESVQQLQTKYAKYSTKEAELYKQHGNNIATMLEHNVNRCYEIINRGDGAYLGRKTFLRLFIAFWICSVIIVLEIVYGLLILFGGL